MTPITVTLPAQTMTVEALEALIAAAKAAVPKPFVPEVGQRVRLTRDNDFGGAVCGRKGDTGVVQEKSWSSYTKPKECRVGMDNGIGRMIVKWDGLEPAPAPTPRYAVGDYAVYVMDPGRAGWGVVEILEVVQTGYRAKSMNPLYGIGTFCPEWLRPATEDEIAAVTRIEPQVNMLVKAKGGGNVYRCYQTSRLVATAQWHGVTCAFCGPLNDLSTLHYDIIPNHLVQGA